MGDTENVGKFYRAEFLSPISAISTRETKQTRNQPKETLCSGLYLLFYSCFGFSELSLGVTLHNFIWLLLVIALVVLIIQLITGRRPL